MANVVNAKGNHQQPKGEESVVPQVHTNEWKLHLSAAEWVSKYSDI